MGQTHSNTLLRTGGISPRFRYIVYSTYVLALSAIVVYLCTHYKGSALKEYFKDDHLIENIQLFDIFAAAVLMFWSVKLLFAEGDDLRWPVLCLAFGLLWATNRELDQFWENRDLRIVYKFFQFLFGIAAAAVVSLRFSICWRQYKKWARSLPLVLLYCAIAIWIIAEITGGVLDDVLRDQMTRDRRRTIKRVVEETLEMYGTPFLLFAAIEMFLAVRRKRPQETGENVNALE